ncbi:hypothetical protein DFH08DRAFT_869724 [Mycena albidolilacea]|uniref:Brain protein I3 n=1 Tax=Mycena albidolilacea TaxID=1033008 RepID=A0AAD7A150_9AGAR|nr:hypothetical protein DFH08DRAFT_869724 [Mycena albidolilacea]
MSNNQVHDSPPTYDEARTVAPARDVKGPQGPPAMNAGPSYVPHPGYVAHAGPSSSPNPVVYHYDNPITGEHVASLLPPNHPEMVCLQSGEHIPHTNYGLLGILAAVFWFPLGVGLCLLDRRVKCQRCGRTIEEGICT